MSYDFNIPKYAFLVKSSKIFIYSYIKVDTQHTQLMREKCLLSIIVQANFNVSKI